MSKSVTIRISDKMADELAAVARTDRMSMSEAIREAIDGHIAARREDQEFRARLKKRLEEDREVLERLAEDS